MKQAKPYWCLIIILAVIKFLLPFILQSPVYELQRDEFLYYQQSQYFDLGYMENPPLLSYLGMISGWLGGSEFWIKFWPSFFGGFTLIISCLIVVEFGGKFFAQFLVGMGIMTGAFLRMHSLFQPNILDIFFWTLSIYFLIRFFKSENKKFFYACAIAFALGILSKYSIIFLIAAIGISLLLTRKRNILIHSFTYKAILLAALIILPNIWWQWQHKWPLIHHMQELQETQLQFLNPLDFIKDQILYLLPVIFIWITGLVWLYKNKEWRFLFFTYFLVIIFLLLGRGKSYYSMGIYPTLIAAGAVSWENITALKKWMRYVIIILILAITIPFIPMLLPIWEPEKLADFYKKYKIEKTGLLKWEDQQDHPLPQDYADMLGWKELTTKAERFYHSLPDTTESNTIIYCRNYGQAGALKFYGKEAWFKALTISDNGSFLHWIPERLSFKNLIFIGRRMPGKDDEVFQHFQKVTIIDSVTNPYSRQLGDKIIFFENIDLTGLRIARDGLQEMKKEFQR